MQKRITKRLLLVLAAICLTANSQAQDAKAKAILEGAQKKMSSLKTLKAGFTLKLLGKNGKTQDSKKGTFMMKGLKYHITFPGQEIICDGKTVWTYMAAANEVQVSSYNPAEQTMSPTKLFTNFYDKEYSYRYLAARKVGGKACDVIELQAATGKSAQFTKVELAIDKSGAIAGGNIFEKNGNQYQYEVNGFTPNTLMADSQFIFDAKAHPKTEVVDLR